jgi:hypothetical protein
MNKRQRGLSQKKAAGAGLRRWRVAQQQSFLEANGDQWSAAFFVL